MINSTLKNANILIVDDNEANIEIITGLLEYQGYSNIISTTDSRLVVDMFRSFNPDLILLDLMMPHLSGFEVMAQLKELSTEHSYLPILVLTADITAEAKQQALVCGASDFLSKPFDLTEVGLRIGNLLYARHLYVELLDHNELLEEKVRERTIELEKNNVELVEAREIAEESERKLEKLNSVLEQRVRDRTKQLETVNKELEAFSYSISHDLRAPLRHINGFIELLLELDSTHRSEEELHFLKVISGGAAEMSALIDALLTFSRLKNTELRKVAINCSSLVAQVLKFFEPEITSRNIIVNVGKLHDCEGDEGLVRQVWINLISNAVKYTGKTADPVIEIGSTENEKEIVYFVRDNGVGFDMQYSKKLFGVFQRLHKASDFEGIGIGLANVNSIVTRHGGFCTAEGVPRQGATFYFHIPKPDKTGK
ncbi:MAG: response regulator [bacterium]